MRKKTTSFIFLGLLALSLVSCYEEYEVYPEISEGAFNFKLDNAQEQEINDSRGVNFMVTDPLPMLERNGIQYPLDRFEIRGESTLNFRRKSFSINMDTSFYLFIDAEGSARDVEEFKLISLVYDFTYIEGAIAHSIFRQLGMWPTHSEYTEVRLNGHTQGLYLLIEDPVEYYLYEQGASLILRRGYNHSKSMSAINELKETKPASVYLARFDSIYSYIRQYDGMQCYDSLQSVLDMPSYFTKMSVDLLLKNGDYTDEVFFYTAELGGKEIYRVSPWDYDDLFQIPHEIGRDWAVGTVFGTRTYESQQDIIDDVGESLVFSIEDDLDYKIAKDSVLYQKYLETLANVMQKIDAEVIEQIMLETRDTLQPFYHHPEIIEQSKYDANKTTQVLFDQNLIDKRQFLLDRREWIIQELHIQKSR
ncbi:MAG: CotH kinase family protein [Bacteroidales bacterium]|nr:CotH kinase family protein [Bacteroidales bacterium]